MLATTVRSDVHERLGEYDKRVLSEICEPGASSWLSVLPLREHGFVLNKGEFRDALALRYAWQLRNTPQTCVCGVDFSVNHALTCKRGGFTTLRHNEVRDLLAVELTQICSSVSTEPALLPVSGEVFLAESTNKKDGARVDIRARGFWTRGEDAYFDVRVFHPNAPSYVSKTLPALYELHEREKKGEYEERINNVEKAAFCPLVFSTYGGSSKQCSAFLKRLCSSQALATGSPYSRVVAVLRCRLSFALLRASILCVRGARSRFQTPVRAEPCVVMAEGRLATE